ncbi:hypothetical protein EAE96_005475 [Botrytis aclada]|nr:hypothetical protein EAE96_005475 [Botrytis aclada]
MIGFIVRSVETRVSHTTAYLGRQTIGNDYENIE